MLRNSQVLYHSENQEIMSEKQKNTQKDILSAQE
jgi:hypothetical protein